jgi:hypothetical protein
MNMAPAMRAHPIHKRRPTRSNDRAALYRSKNGISGWQQGRHRRRFNHQRLPTREVQERALPLWLTIYHAVASQHFLSNTP